MSPTDRWASSLVQDTPTATPTAADPSPGIVLWFAGEMTTSVAHGWEDLVYRLWARGPRPVALDLSAVTLLTCAGIGSMGCTSTEARRLGVPFELRQVPRQSARLLHWAGLEHLIASYHGEQDPPARRYRRVGWSSLAGVHTWPGGEL